MTTTATVTSFISLGVCAILYLLPAINAKSRKHPSTGAIFLLNLFLGWTVIGWLAALIWSATATSTHVTTVTNPSVVNPGEDKYQKLERLGGLKDKGLITAAEYEAEKSKILGS
ncbi:superinfection immunity protein [Pseudomonas sp. NPDC089392]|uniref:superinfection immunity protein n=1 Tax=Pseudomonas TaxID=286 RepID=UPI001F43B86B|nr:superinfection immunity protein [Pseudomonas putida]MCF1251929.1 superinfection immunity protein [Pseudomonas putida]